MEPEPPFYFRERAAGGVAPACVDPSSALELNLAEFPSPPASPWQYHRHLEGTLAAARARRANRVWVRVAPKDHERQQVLERWGFVRFDDVSSQALFVRGISAPSASDGRPIQKVDPPLDTDAAILEVVRQFETCTLPFENWTHRAHVAVALVYLRRSNFAEALDRFRRHVQLYNQLRGDPAGYDEELTQYYLRQIATQSSPATPLAKALSVGWAKRSAGPPTTPPPPQ